MWNFLVHLANLLLKQKGILLFKLATRETTIQYNPLSIIYSLSTNPLKSGL